MSNVHLVGVACQPKRDNRQRLALPAWGVKAALRLSQLKKPGIYGLVLVVGEDGSRSLVVNDGRAERLGKNASLYQCIPNSPRLDRAG